MNAAGSISDLSLTGGGTMTLSGSGTLTMSNNLNNRIYGGNTTALIIGANQVVQGAGQIGLSQTTITNDGTITADQSVPLNISVNGGGFTNHGTLEVVNGSTMNIAGPAAGSFTSDGTVKIASGGALTTSAPAVYTRTGGITIVDGTLTSVAGVDINGGTLAGTGTVVGGVSVAGGTIQPGGLTTPGTLTINGNFGQSTAAFNELIGSTGNGLLFINGTSNLGSGAQLNIDLLGGFTPFSGETFTLMDFFSGSGTFANAPTTGFQMDGFNWTIAYNANDIVLDAGSSISGASTPEPSSLLLMSAGLAALASSFWKKRAAATRAELPVS